MPLVIAVGSQARPVKLARPDLVLEHHRCTADQQQAAVASGQERLESW